MYRDERNMILSYPKDKAKLVVKCCEFLDGSICYYAFEILSSDRVFIRNIKKTLEPMYRSLSKAERETIRGDISYFADHGFFVSDSERPVLQNMVTTVESAVKANNASIAVYNYKDIYDNGYKGDMCPDDCDGWEGFVQFVSDVKRMEKSKSEWEKLVKQGHDEYLRYENDKRSEEQQKQKEINEQKQEWLKIQRQMWGDDVIVRISKRGGLCKRVGTIEWGKYGDVWLTETEVDALIDMLGLKQTAMRIDALSEYRRAGNSYYWRSAGFTDVNDYEAVYHWHIRSDFESSWYADFREKIELKLALEKAEEKKRQEAERQAILAKALEGIVPPTIDSFTAMDFASYGIENTVTSDKRSAVADDDSYNPYDEIVSAVDDNKEDNRTVFDLSLEELTSEDADASEIIDPDVVDCDEADDTTMVDTDDDRTIDFDPVEFLSGYHPDPKDIEDICDELDSPLIDTVTDDDKVDSIEDGVGFSGMSEASNGEKQKLTPLGKVLEMLHHWSAVYKR